MKIWILYSQPFTNSHFQLLLMWFAEDKFRI